MRLWTIQGIAIYEQLIRDGIAYCTKPLVDDDEQFIYAYHWMAEQMRKRIGEPPVEGIEYPMWAWCQYDSAKRKRPPRSPWDMSEGINAYLEVEIPDNQVLLSGYSNWHCVLNQGPLDNWRQISKKRGKLEEEAGRRLDFKELPNGVKDEIRKSWEAVFDLDRRDKDVQSSHKRNISIQATFWVLRQEHVISVEFHEKTGSVVKPIKWSPT